jgi:threonine/homoserine/homoserine lactone efflux protein
VAAFLVLGLVFNVTGTLWNLGVAWGAGRLAQSGPVAGARVWLERLLGAVFVALGVRLALSERT